MAGPVHTYGPTCLLSSAKVDHVALRSSPTPPKVHAQFFYTSSLPIDDPLTPLPAATTNSASAHATSAPQPFSARDNLALEEAWKALGEARTALLKENPSPSVLNTIGTTKNIPLRERKSDHVATLIPGSSAEEESSAPDVSFKHQSHDTNQDKARVLTWPKRREVSPLGRRFKSAKRKSVSSPGADNVFPEAVDIPHSYGESSSTTRISGSPFARAPSRLSMSVSEPDSRENTQRDSVQFQEVEDTQEVDFAPQPSDINRAAAAAVKNLDEANRPSENSEVSREDPAGESVQYKVPVGASRLHLVELPELKMKPIYWSPLHDISDVLRTTWFYKNTMLPVEAELANQLEDGYLYMRAWTDTWQDELNSCVEYGADAEMKIVHKLWQEDPHPISRPGTSQEGQTQNSKINEGTQEKRKDLTFEQNLAASGSDNSSETKPFKNASVIYVDAKDAQILRPSLLPSVSRNRRPLSSIRKGRQIGIPVVRGFNRKAWDRLHPSKQANIDMRHYLTQPQSRRSRGEQICYACAIEDSRPSPSDLVFVIHGIGQKLSERMESFHFTHAINDFRRSVNMELNNEEIWSHIRPDHGGIMVLPVNWRSTLALADAEIDSLNVDDPTANRFTLKDLTPDTIPAIRSLISDVMLDIPYYLSHHKEKMIRAVIHEANRVYRLWCQHNPGFHENGRVHLLAHSLGSAMAVDILSDQPTKLPEIDFSSTKVEENFFEFDSKNVFFCGSPVGIFLLLNRANLVPRRGRDKPGREREDMERRVGGDAKKYGCLALDNLYNVMHTTDPIAYRLNAAVDSDLAASLKPASVPTSSSSFFSSLSNVFHWRSSTNSAAALSAMSARPAAVSKLPSTVEMETHDFTREELAEKRMLLLNDNGQIDYLLSGGGGPLNIQYLNMLSAHSSYWTLPDFVRFIVVEIARRQDPDGTLLALRAEKKKGWKA